MRVANISHTTLETSHAIRQAVYPTELNSNNAAVQGLIALVHHNGIFATSFHFTNAGLIEMMRDFHGTHKSDLMDYVGKPLFHALRLRKHELGRYPISSYHRYHRIFKRFANDYVDEAFSTDKDVDVPARKWADAVCANTSSHYKDVIKRIISGMYFEQVRHKMLSNDYILYFIIMYPPIVRGQEQENNYYIEAETIRILDTAYQTDTVAVSFTKNLSFLFTESRLRNVYTKMHQDVQRIERGTTRGTPSKLVWNLLPSRVSVSTSS